MVDCEKQFEIFEGKLDLTVAIIIHGEPRDIKRTIESVKRQKYTLGAIEIICLDDGTSPEARTVLDELSIKTLDIPRNSSISFAKNAALKHCEGKFTFFLDDHIYLMPGGLQGAVELLVAEPKLAGVCGYYQSPSISDWNTLRDIKRHSIYGKSTQGRVISLEDFTTFSTGIAVVRKSVFETLDFPEAIFPPDFGGEDVPALLTALNSGCIFYYLPTLGGWHDHGLSFRDIIAKLEIEVRGRFSLFYWIGSNPDMRVPYLHGFMNFPLLLSISLPIAISAKLMGYGYVLYVPIFFLAVEVLHSLRCLRTPISYPLAYRFIASFYVLVSDLLTPMCALQYAVSRYKRPYHRLGLERALVLVRVFLCWEVEKLAFPFRRIVTVPNSSQSEERASERHFGEPQS